MKRFIFGLAFLETMFAGCQTEPMNETLIVGSSVFDASTEVFVPQTKTSMTQDKQVVWSRNDRLAIFQGCTVADEFLVTDSSDGKTNANFNIVRDNSDVNGSFSAGTEVPCNVAIYPYAEDLSLSGASIDGGTAYKIEGVVLPAVQNYVAGSFGNGAFPMVAVTETMSDHNLRFKNVLGAMKLQLKGTQAVTSITLQGKNNEKLSGVAIVTAYTDETKPAITMASGASNTVTINCDNGIQLNESKSTEFIIALPPVLFSQGFTVTVIDSEDETYTVETDKANTVLRSSLLVMPEFKLGNKPSDEESGDDELIIPVITVSLNYASIKLYEGDVTQLTATVKPKDATDQTVVWSSDNPAVATVDQTGLVTAVSKGATKISATAGGKVATCTVEVSSAMVANADYIDEYGVNHGKGIAVGMAIWAPVNCGYHKDDFKYGKLYQWGRRYGQGYGSSDASVPVIEGGGVSVVTGNHKNKGNVFFTSTSDFKYDWLYPHDGTLWNSGSESEPVKTEYDPCPEGWRVPTYAELNELRSNRSSWTSKNGQLGFWFSGAAIYTSDAPQVFLPAAGYRDSNDSDANYRGDSGCYWSSRSNINFDDYYAYSLYFYSYNAAMTSEYRAYGYSVRCVQE